MPARNDDLPDSTHPHGLCPRCTKQSSFDVVGALPVTLDGGRILGRGEPDQLTHSEQVAVLMCRNCSQGVAVVEEKLIGGIRWSEGGRAGVVAWQGFHWWPLAGMVSDPAVPPAIASALSEATMCLAANCPRAAAVMARRTLEAIALDQGEASGTLVQKLKKLADRQVLQPTLAEWSKEVRLIGNAGAHYDPINDVAHSDAVQLVEFVQELLRYLYVLPHELNKRRGATP